MSQRIVIFAGISGVGKTFFLNNLADLLKFQHINGGSLIVAARNAASNGRDYLRHTDLDENQRLLIEGFKLAQDPNAELVIIDGHVVIDDGEGLTKISREVFEALKVEVVVHLEADSTRVAKNRSQDTSRSRPRYSTEALIQHQDTSRLHARFIAESLKIEFHIVTHDDVKYLAKLLKG